MDSFPKCQTCHQHFSLKGPAPYLLPCLHSVCETCMTSAAGGVITCSTCQKEVNLIETYLQKDVVRQREIFHLTVKHHPSDVLCTHEDDGNQAVCWCQECEEFLCEYCHTLHEGFKATRRHAVQEMADIQPSSLDQDEYCQIHKNCPLDFWDPVCKVCICSRCRLGDHAEHDVVATVVAADAVRLEIETFQKEIQQVCTSQNSFLDTTRKQLQDAEERSDTLRDKISHTFHALKTRLDQREKELLMQLHQNKDETKSHLDSKTFSGQSNHLRCKVTADYIQKTLMYSSKYDLLKLQKMIADTTSTCLASAPPEEQRAFPLPDFYTDGLETLQTTHSSFGDISTSKSQLPPVTNIQADYLAKLEEASQKYKENEQILKSDLKTSNSKLMELQTLVKALESDAKETRTRCLIAEADVSRLQTSVTEHEKEKAVITQKWEQQVMTLNCKIIELEGQMATLSKQKREAEYAIQEFQTRQKKAQSRISQMETSVGELTGEKEEMKKQESAVAVHLETLLRQQGIYFLTPKITAKSFLLQCIQLKFDRDRVNIKAVHVTTEGNLVNTPGSKPHDNSKDRLVKYTGTTSTVPLPGVDPPQYWEVRGRVGIDEALTGNKLLLEIGLCVEEERDQYHCIAERPHSYSLNVAHCTTHSSICREVRKHGEHVLCLPDTLPNTPGLSTALQYGVVFDDSCCRVVFIDLNTNKVMSVIDGVDCSRPLWPMFGVYNPHLTSPLSVCH